MNGLWFCVLAVLVAAVVTADESDNLDKADQGLLKVIWKRLALEWKEKFEEEELRNTELTQRVNHLERQLQQSSGQRSENMRAVDTTNKEMRDQENSVEGREFRVAVLTNRTLPTQEVDLRIVSSQDTEVTATVTTSVKAVVYVIPPHGFVQIPLRQEDCDDCEGLPATHVVSATPVAMKIVTQKDGKPLDEFTAPPLSDDPAAIVLIADSDIQDILIEDKDGKELHKGTILKGQHLFLPRSSTVSYPPDFRRGLKLFSSGGRTQVGSPLIWEKLKG